MTVTVNPKTGKVEVEPCIVLYAFRYGIGRATYAHKDALALVWAHWPVLKQWTDTIRRDLEDVLDRPHPAATEDDMQLVKELIEWIDLNG